MALRASSNFIPLLLVMAIILCQTEWISPSGVKLPRGNNNMAVAHYNNSIHLLGGYNGYTSSELVEYDISDNLFIDHGENILPIGIFGWSSYYTQIEHILYFIDHQGDALSAYDLSTKSLDSHFVAIPTNVADKSCLASNRHYLFVIGGYNRKTGTLNIVQIFDKNNDEWLVNVSSMLEPRTDHSCIIVPFTNVLYVIGGYVSIDKQSQIHTKTIEKIDTNNIVQNKWSYIQSLLTSASWSRAVLHDNAVYIIGGGDGDPPDCNPFDTVQIIDLMTEIVSISAEKLIYPVMYASSIIVGDTLYAFGGWNKIQDHLDTLMVYQFAQKSTKEPTTTSTGISPSNDLMHSSYQQSWSTQELSSTPFVQLNTSTLIRTSAVTTFMYDTKYIPSQDGSLSFNESSTASNNEYDNNDVLVYVACIAAVVVISAVIAYYLYKYIVRKRNNKQQQIVIEINAQKQIVVDNGNDTKDVDVESIVRVDDIEGMEVTQEGAADELQNNKADNDAEIDLQSSTIQNTRFNDWAPTMNCDA